MVSTRCASRADNTTESLKSCDAPASTPNLSRIQKLLDVERMKKQLQSAANIAKSLQKDINELRDRVQNLENSSSTTSKKRKAVEMYNDTDEDRLSKSIIDKSYNNE
jgi:hypothetical protein